MRRGVRRGKFSSGAVHERAAPFEAAGGRRDSDTSLCSSRPSSAGSRPSVALLTDRSSQVAALRSVNAYLSANSAPVSLKPPLPSARDITEALRFLLSRLDWPLANLEADLPFVLRALRCPLKLSKSALRAPGTPHAWPTLLSAIHWLVQLASYSDHCASSSPTRRSPNDILNYVMQSYSLFLRADDDAVADLDDEYLQKTRHHSDATAAVVAALEREVADLDGKLRAVTSGPSPREALEGERGLLVEDVKKFEKVVDTWGARVAAMESRLGEREKELEVKEGEGRRLHEENAELRRRVEAQAVSARDAERMRRELQALERDIAEAESGRNAAEEKAWELEAAIGRKLKELEALTIQCNLAIRKLKLGNDIQYVLNAKGSSPAEVMGIDYKTTLKPALSALAEDTKKASVSKLEELITLQEKSREDATMLEEKRKHLAVLQAKCEEAEVRLSVPKKEMEDNTSKCAAEAARINEELTRKEQQLEILEKEAEDLIKASEQKLQFAVRESEEETQMCARELLAMIDAISEYKEYMESTAYGMKKDLSETARMVAESHKASVSEKLRSIGPNLCHGDLKRARYPSPNQMQ